MDLLETILRGFYGFMEAGPAFPVGLVYLALAGIPVTLLHELGHAWVARKLLGGEARISVGHAGKIAEFQLGEITASINLFGSPTRATQGSAELDLSRATVRDVVWIALAGPAASMVGFLLAVILYSAAPAVGIVHGVLWAAVADGFFATLNLIPFVLKDRCNGPGFASDGRVALDALRVAAQLRRGMVASETRTG